MDIKQNRKGMMVGHLTQFDSFIKKHHEIRKETRKRKATAT